MKILLDENLNYRLRRFLLPHEAITARFAGFSGLKNGNLLRAADAAGFDAIITGDRTLEYEQNLKKYSFKVIVVFYSRWEELKSCAPSILEALESAQAGVATRVDCGIFRRKRDHTLAAKEPKHGA